MTVRGPLVEALVVLLFFALVGTLSAVSLRGVAHGARLRPSRGV